MDKFIILPDTSDIKSYVNKKVEITGTISEMPWQHMIDFPETHTSINYFDVDGDQIVVYSGEVITCPGQVTVRGTVCLIEGESKRPGSTDVFREFHIIADSWQCL